MRPLILTLLFSFVVAGYGCNGNSGGANGDSGVSLSPSLFLKEAVYDASGTWELQTIAVPGTAKPCPAGLAENLAAKWLMVNQGKYSLGVKNDTGREYKVNISAATYSMLAMWDATDSAGNTLYVSETITVDLSSNTECHGTQRIEIVWAKDETNCEWDAEIRGGKK